MQLLKHAKNEAFLANPNCLLTILTRGVELLLGLGSSVRIRELTLPRVLMYALNRGRIHSNRIHCGVNSEAPGIALMSE